MKEASGEANMTVVFAISVGVLATFFFTVVWPMLKGDYSKNSDCNKARCDCSITVRNDHGGRCWCTTKDNTSGFECIYKG